MASKGAAAPLKAVAGCAARARLRPNVAQPFNLPYHSRSMATETALATESASSQSTPALTTSAPLPLEAQSCLTTIYRFPTMEPLEHATYPATHLRLPLRRDLLHRAIVFEGDATRQGTASTKTRYEVHGSNRKMRPQKGTGRARLGDKKNPMLRGGGVAHGPKPRDFSTELPRKMYDLAWRTALSYRYSKGELIVVDRFKELMPKQWRHKTSRFFMGKVFAGWGKKDEKSLIITVCERWNGRRNAGDNAVVRTADDVDVKDLLKLGTVVVEKSALDKMLMEHQSDLTKVRRGAALPQASESTGASELVQALESQQELDSEEAEEREEADESAELDDLVQASEPHQSGELAQENESEKIRPSEAAM